MTRDYVYDPGFEQERTLRPGGWIVIEDYDWTCFGFEGQHAGPDGVGEAIMEFMKRAGYERDYGRHVVADLTDVGCTDVRGEGRARMISASDPGFDFFRLSVESLRGAVVDAGLLSADDADALSVSMDGDMRVLTPMTIAGRGRRA
jgi:hypothetical protein